MDPLVAGLLWVLSDKFLGYYSKDVQNFCPLWTMWGYRHKYNTHSESVLCMVWLWSYWNYSIL